MPKFSKKERLKSKKKIEELFRSGKKINKYPLLLIYKTNAELKNHQIAFSVSKKNFKNATDRNYIKRKLREIYRNKKEEFLISKNKEKSLVLFLIYNSNKKPKFEELEHKIILILTLLKNKIQNDF